MSSDLALMQRLLKNDRTAFEAIVQEHQRAVHAFLRARVLTTSDAEDLTQDVFVRFYIGRERFDSNSLIRPWLLGIARNLLREYLRKMKRRKEVGWTELCLELDDLIQGRQDAQYEDAATHLPTCLGELGQSARQAIEWKYSSNLPLAEIGQKLKRSEGAVKLLMFRARQALKYCLDGKLRKPGA